MLDHEISPVLTSDLLQTLAASVGPGTNSFIFQPEPSTRNPFPPRVHACM